MRMVMLVLEQLVQQKNRSYRKCIINGNLELINNGITGKKFKAATSRRRNSMYNTFNNPPGEADSRTHLDIQPIKMYILEVENLQEK